MTEICEYFGGIEIKTFTNCYAVKIDWQPKVEIFKFNAQIVCLTKNSFFIFRLVNITRAVVPKKNLQR